MSTNQSTTSVFTVSPEQSNFISNYGNEIPQLDGKIDFNSPVSTTSLEIKFENCGKIFETEKRLKDHTDKHEWGCDDCLLCFTTKYSADLHELEYHGHDPDSLVYIRDHIPDTTKRLFAAGHRQR